MSKTLVKVLAFINVLAFIWVVVVNFLAVKLPIWWMSTWELSDLYPNLFTPTGLTFSIWWLIYLLLTIFLVYQIVDLFSKKTKNITKKIWIWFLMSCLTNIWRIFARHYRLVFLSVIVIVLFFITLVIISKKVEIWKKLWNRKDKFFVQVPFSVYLWRLSVAVIANTSALLVYLWRNMFWLSDVFWTIVVIIVATIITLINLYKKYDIIFSLVVIWAFLWIILKRLDIDPIYAKSIIWTVWVCIVMISTWIGLSFEKWKKN